MHIPAASLISNCLLSLRCIICLQTSILQPQLAGRIIHSEFSACSERVRLLLPEAAETGSCIHPAGLAVSEGSERGVSVYEQKTEKISNAGNFFVYSTSSVKPAGRTVSVHNFTIKAGSTIFILKGFQSGQRFD